MIAGVKDLTSDWLCWLTKIGFISFTVIDFWDSTAERGPCAAFRRPPTPPWCLSAFLPDPLCAHQQWPEPEFPAWQSTERMLESSAGPAGGARLWGRHRLQQLHHSWNSETDAWTGDNGELDDAVKKRAVFFFFKLSLFLFWQRMIATQFTAVTAKRGREILDFNGF